MIIDSNRVDIKENDILSFDAKLLAILLCDNSTLKNIIWATNNYEPLGKEYQQTAEILPRLISGENGTIIRPRVNKTRHEQLSRIKDKAEVFTPSWVCNQQNNIIDTAWFGKSEVFNVETSKGWKSRKGPISFPTRRGKTWQDYVQATRLEITCGEAPYLVSRYDTISGATIEVPHRIGLLDRKLRVVSENAHNKEAWLHWAKVAYQSSYGYEWQGDSLVLARENLLYTYIDYYFQQFREYPSKDILREIAVIISWNIWQMDGLKQVVPHSCSKSVTYMVNLFGDKEKIITACHGCKNDSMHQHNGIYCLIKDWKSGKTIPFISLLKS